MKNRLGLVSGGILLAAATFFGGCQARPNTQPWSLMPKPATTWDVEGQPQAAPQPQPTTEGAVRFTHDVD